MTKSNLKPKLGQVDFTNIHWVPVINCVLKYQDKILVVKRNKELNFYPNYWNGISGFLDDNKTLMEKIKEELVEEVGLKEDKINGVFVGEIFHQLEQQYNKTWIVHPVLVEVKTNKINLDQEAVDYKWLNLDEVKKLKLLPGFEKVLEKLPLENKNEYLHEVAITAIIKKDNKYLITRRSLNKRRFPGKWTVPGGKMETDDYLKLPKDTEFYWYNVLENTLKREVKEEVGIKIDNIKYLTSLATIHKDGRPSLVISCLADFAEGEIELKIDENDKFAWVNLKEAKDYELLDGIYDELIMADKIKEDEKEKWCRH